MEVKVVSETKQEFNGEAFYLCGPYFQRKGRRLHREVWKFHNGEIPKGYHIHHSDGNRHNNDISNLEMIKGGIHETYHMNLPDRKEKSRKNIKTAIVAAAEWHGSEEGLAWHSKQGKANWQRRKLNTYQCSFCGKEFQTKHVYPKGSNHFCHANCKQRALWRRRHESKIS